MQRRDFLQLSAAGGGAVFFAGLAGCTAYGGTAAAQQPANFYFVQLSDTHWGFEGPPQP